MKIGILLCDRVALPLRARHGDYPEMYSSWLSQASPAFSYVFFDAEQGELPKNPNVCDAYLISGSRHSVNHGERWMGALESFVRQLHAHQKKLIGICFGHQLIAKALGGKVSRALNGWGVGVSVNAITQSMPWMTPGCDTINLLVSHSEQVTELPKSSILLASSDFCPYYLLQIEQHILTVQGHPEFTKNYARDLINLRRKELPAARYQQGIQSLKLNTDGEIMAKWIWNFFRSISDGDTTAP